VTGKATTALAACGAMMLCLIVLVGGIFSAQQAADAACTPWGPLGAVAGGPDLTVTQANIKVSLPDAKLREDLAAVVATQPDFISLNEMQKRTNQEITPAGYAVWRDPAATGQARSTAVLWRTDRWHQVASGRVIMVDHGPQRWDHDRAATWVTLEDTDGGQVSMISAHHMINPANHGPDKPLRQQLYREGLAKVQTLIAGLSSQGPVFLAGDLNATWTNNDSWAPRAMLGAIGMRNTMDVLGAEPTHDGGGIIDYIFFQPTNATPVSQRTQALNSDHRLLTATFRLGAPSAAAPAAHTTAAPDTADVPGYTADQARNAAAVLAAGQELGVPAKGQAIALMTALGESGLHVLDHGDAAGADSRGLFQQRDNGAWGTLADRMDPRRSSLMFYRALLRVPGWETMEPTLAAHAVQGNADPYYYTPYWDRALSLMAELTGTGVTSALLANGASTTCDQAVMVSPGSVVWPVPASMANSNLNNFGETGPNWSSYHTGTDFSVPCGTPVYAATDGAVVVDHTQSWAGPNLVKVSTGPGHLTTWYAHMQTVTVQDGQTVIAGQQIGEVGAEGNATGCHLHFELHPRGGSIYEDATDPTPWLAANVGKTLAGA